MGYVVDELGSVIGVVSGLLAIFTFATGINSVAELRRLQSTHKSAATSESKLVLRKLLVVIPLFGVSIAVTAAQGLSGSDTGGILSLLLILGLLAVLGFHWLGIDRIIPVTTYGVITWIAIAGLGFLFGTISRGEEGFGLAAGMAIGAGSWAITALTRRQFSAPIADRPQSLDGREGLDAAAELDHERTILEIASQQNGQVRVTDIALKSKLPLDAAARTLDGLVQRGYCRRETLESGATVYRFPDLEVK